MDPLDWVHQWEQYEMMMYVSIDEGEDGIFMQVTERAQRDGAEEWVILYDRMIAPLPDLTLLELPVGSQGWEERVLRHHLNEHPRLVTEEKEFLMRWRG